MATAGAVLNVVQEIEQVANEVLAGIEALDPALALPVTAITALEGLAQAAITAWSQASGVPVTVASVQALLPNPTPLTPPTS
jgi:uncharacterized YccA/Bax inhibitor family protein